MESLTVDHVSKWLTKHHDGPIESVVSLSGGYWSSAFAYRAGGRDLVIRIGEITSGFEMDREAYELARVPLPVPEVFDIGPFEFDGSNGTDLSFAISERKFGTFLEMVEPANVETAGPMVEALLRGLASVPAAPQDTVALTPGSGVPNTASWRDYLRWAITDDPSNIVSGWRTKLETYTDSIELFLECERRIHELLDVCPERRDLVHADLLHQNVLVGDGAKEVTAIFSWKCGIRGDLLYEVAGLTFWGPWFPGIEAIDLWHRVIGGSIYPYDALEHAAERHHCYELVIGAHHLGWNAWNDDSEQLAKLTNHLLGVLERGPL